MNGVSLRGAGEGTVELLSIFPGYGNPVLRGNSHIVQSDFQQVVWTALRGLNAARSALALDVHSLDVFSLGSNTVLVVYGQPRRG